MASGSEAFSTSWDIPWQPRTMAASTMNDSGEFQAIPNYKVHQEARRHSEVMNHESYQDDVIDWNNREDCCWEFGSPWNVIIGSKCISCLNRYIVYCSIFWLNWWLRFFFFSKPSDRWANPKNPDRIKPVLKTAEGSLYVSWKSIFISCSLTTGTVENSIWKLKYGVERTGK